MKVDQPNGPHEYIKRVVLEAASPYARPPTFAYDKAPGYEPCDPLSLGSLFPPSSLGALSIRDINTECWSVRAEMDYSDEFKKVAAIVGRAKAAKVCKALGAAVPADWETKAGAVW
jgi:hypothetical protein